MTSRPTLCDPGTLTNGPHGAEPLSQGPPWTPPRRQKHVLGPVLDPAEIIIKKTHNFYIDFPSIGKCLFFPGFQHIGEMEHSRRRQFSLSRPSLERLRSVSSFLRTAPGPLQSPLLVSWRCPAFSQEGLGASNDHMKFQS